MKKKKRDKAIRIAGKYMQLDPEKYPLALGYMLGRQEAEAEQRLRDQNKDKSA